MRRTTALALLLAACAEPLGFPPDDADEEVSEYRPAHFFPLAVEGGRPAPNLFDGWARVAQLDARTRRTDMWFAGEDELVLLSEGGRWRRQVIPPPTGLDPENDCAPCDPGGAGGAGGASTCLPLPPDEPAQGGGGGEGAGGEGGAPEEPDPGLPDLRGIWARELPVPEPEEGELPAVPEVEVYAAGTRGTVVRFKNGVWSREPVVRRAVPQDPGSAHRVTADLNGIDGSGSSVAVVGQAGLVALRNPELCRFEVQARATQETLNAVMVRGRELVAVGNLGAIVVQSFGSDPVRRRVAGLTAALRGIWGPGTSRFYVVGLDGTLLRAGGDFPELTFSEITGAPRVYLRDVWGTSMRDVFLVGWNGTIAHFDGEEVRELVDQRSSQRFSPNRLEFVLGFPKPPRERDPDAPAPPEPPEGALITDAATVYAGGVTGTLLQGP